MSVHEARAFGIPVLAYEAGYIKTHIIPGENGYFYGSISKLAQACVEFIRRPERLEELRTRCLHFRGLESYTWQDAARLFLKQFFDWEGHTASPRSHDDRNS